MMRQERRKCLERNLLEFTSNMMHLDSILIYLISKQVLTETLADRIKTSSTDEQVRLHELIKILKTRGDVAFETFFHALLHTQQPLMADLLRPMIDGNVLQSIGNTQQATVRLSTSCSTLFPNMLSKTELDLLEDLQVDMIDGGESSPEIEMYERNKGNIYANFSSPKGLCMIINNVEFAGSDTRQGTEIDQKRIQQVFVQLGYIVEVKSNLTGKEMLSAVKSFGSDPRHMYSSSAVVIVLTHGEYDVLKGTDDEGVSVHRFLEPLNAVHAPGLRGKPKLVFLQACRGDRRDYGFTSTDSTDSHSATDGFFNPFSCVMPSNRSPVTNSKIPWEADFLIAYSTPPTFVSWRNSAHGSWFIQSICKVFATYAKHEHILDLMTRVNKTVAEEYESTNRNQPHLPTPKQMPEICSRLRRQFYFFPGVVRSTSV